MQRKKNNHFFFCFTEGIEYCTVEHSRQVSRTNRIMKHCTTNQLFRKVFLK